jgi:hypothetical protein
MTHGRAESEAFASLPPSGSLADADRSSNVSPCFIRAASTISAMHPAWSGCAVNKQLASKPEFGRRYLRITDHDLSTLKRNASHKPPWLTTNGIIRNTEQLSHYSAGNAWFVVKAEVRPHARTAFVIISRSEETGGSNPGGPTS